MEIKRGYAKWTDENGVFHKVRVEDVEWKKEDGSHSGQSSLEESPTQESQSTFFGD